MGFQLSVFSSLALFLITLLCFGSTSSRYEFYYALLRDFPDLRFTINGGINTIDEVMSSLTCIGNDSKA